MCEFAFMTGHLSFLVLDTQSIGGRASGTASFPQMIPFGALPYILQLLH
jgi:hypothetical protein